MDYVREQPTRQGCGRTRAEAIFKLNCYAAMVHNFILPSFHPIYQTLSFLKNLQKLWLCGIFLKIQSLTNGTKT